MTNKPINICRAIDCPYNSDSGGCQRFLRPFNCPLPKQPQFASGISPSTWVNQYWLYGDMNEGEVTQAKAFMEGWLLQDEQYQMDIETKQAGWDVTYPKRIINKETP
jgi:hypothetical protein